MLGKVLQFAVIATIIGVSSARFLAKSNLPQAGAVALAARPASAPAPKPAVATNVAYGRNEARVAANVMGQYSTDVEINGSRVHMLVDTGASSVALSYDDAAAVGAYPAPADYKYAVSTANGTAHVARVVLHQVRLGALIVYDVEAFVAERGALSTSLLGMTFLSKLSRIEVADGALVLRQ